MLIFYFQPSPVISVHSELIIYLCFFGSRNRCSSLVGGTLGEFFRVIIMQKVATSWLRKLHSI